MLQAELKILGGKHQGKLIPLATKKFLVGREQDCHLRPNSDLVSRHHCVFSIDDYAIRLRDLGSTNGTLVNGVNLRGEVSLKSGDRVTIGKLELEVVIRQSSAKAASVAPQVIAELSPPLSTVEMLTQSDETETSYELAAFPATVPVEESVVAPADISDDTAIIGMASLQYPQALAPGYPPVYPQMMPGAYMPPQYPQYPPGYGQMPGYAPQMGYPMGYPQMMPMQPGYPGVAVAAPPVAATEEEPEDDILAVKLPNPDETGAKPPAPPQTGAGAAKKEEKPSNTAADIIKQYMNRRS